MLHQLELVNYCLTIINTQLTLRTHNHETQKLFNKLIQLYKPQLNFYHKLRKKNCIASNQEPAVK